MKMLISIIGGVEVVAEVERRGVSTVKNPPILILIKNDDLLTPLCSSHLFRYLSRRIDPEKKGRSPFGSEPFSQGYFSEIPRRILPAVQSLPPTATPYHPVHPLATIKPPPLSPTSRSLDSPAYRLPWRPPVH